MQNNYSFFSLTQIQDLREYLALYGQGHLLRFWNILSDSEKHELISDIQEIDFVTSLADFRKATANCTKTNAIQDVKPIPESIYGDVNGATPEELQCYKERAMQIIADSKLAVLVLAGGQGTRLGVPYPKGE